MVKEEGAPLITKMLIHNDDLHSEDLADLQIVPQYKGIRVAIGEYYRFRILTTLGEATKTLFECQGNGLYASR